RAVAARVAAAEQHTQVVPVRTDAGDAPAQVFRERVMHSLPQVIRRAQVFDLEVLSAPDLRVAPGSRGRQLAHGRRPCSHDYRPHPHQLRVPDLEGARLLLAGGDSFEQAVPLLEDPPQTGESSGVSRLDLHEELVEEPPALVRTSFDQPEVVGPEERDPEVAGEVERPLPGAIDLDGAARTISFHVESDCQLHPAAGPRAVGLGRSRPGLRGPSNSSSTSFSPRTPNASRTYRALNAI